ncbi:MAG: glutathione S-transferase family protein [Deltaproteobacteria bacterium]|nr:glutathione S-transferase family protein [Deltaproteobacteria bacterium]
MPKIHGVSASPFVRKVLVAMAEKSLAYEIVPVMPFAPSPEFKKLSPLGKIPVYQDGDFILPDSSCILAYLEKAHPTPALMPSDPKLYGTALFLEEYADTRLMEAAGAVFFERIVKAVIMKQPADEERVRKAIGELMPAALDYLEPLAPDGEGIVGGRFGVADIAIGSQLVNWMHAGERLDATKYPRMAAYVDRIHARPSFKTLIEQERKLFAAR